MKHVKSSVLLLMLVSTILFVAAQISSVNAQGEDFAVTISPPRGTIGSDGTATYSVKVSSINGFSGTVVLSTNGLSQRTEFQSTSSFQPSVLVVAPNSDVYSVLTVTVFAPSNSLYPSGYQAGQQYSYYYPYGETISFNVVASSGAITKNTAVNLDVLAYYTYSLDINMNLNPGSILLSGDITQTVTEQLTITVTGQNVRGGDVISVTPQLYDVPNGLSASFSPGSGRITASGQSVVFATTLLMTPDFLAKSGTYSLAVGITAFLPTGAFGQYYNYASNYGYYRTGLFKAAILTVVVPPFITISTTPSILNVYIGGTDQVMQINVNTLSNGNISPISIGVQGVPEGVITNLQNSILTPRGGQPATTNLVFSAPATFASGIYPITISATAFGVTKYANASIYVRPQGGFSLTASEQQIAMVPSGDTHAVTITIQPQGGFRATVQLSVSQLPPGVSASLSTDTVTVQSDSPVQIVLTLVASTRAVPGTYSVSVVAGTGISQTTTNITLVIRSGTSQIWPIVFIVVVLVGVASAISFIAIPRGKHVHVLEQG
jgi:hypothetical protein